MKICFLIGQDNHSGKWTNYFKKNHEVFVLDIKRPKSKILQIIYNVLSVRRQIRKINPDILHAHYAGVNGVLGALSGFHPYVLTAHGSDILIAPKSFFVRPLIKYALKKADLITCDANHMIVAMKKLGADENKIKRINFGIDTDIFKPGDKEPIDKLNIGDNKVVISLRNLEPVYNLETLIYAIPNILDKIPNTVFIIAGKGSEEKKLKELAESLGVSNNIRFVGWLTSFEISNYLRLADVLVSTSLSDAGIGASTAEAMATGLPVVITDFGENKEWVKGYLFPMKNKDVLAQMVIELLNDKNKRIKIGEYNREVIKERNDYYKEMEKMERLLQEKKP